MRNQAFSKTQTGTNARNSWLRDTQPMLGRSVDGSIEVEMPAQDILNAAI